MRCCFFATTINYMDRQILGLLAPLLQSQIPLDRAAIRPHRHRVSGGLCDWDCLGFGSLIDRLGTRRGYFISVLLWSIAAAAHSRWSDRYFGFGVVRFAPGTRRSRKLPRSGESRCGMVSKARSAPWPMASSIPAPISGRSWRHSAVPWIVHHWGWQAAFVALGSLGIFWLVAWWLDLRFSGKLPSRIPRRACTYLQ